MKAVYLGQAEGLSIVLLGPARSSVDVLVLNHMFFPLSLVATVHAFFTSS